MIELSRRVPSRLHPTFNRVVSFPIRAEPGTVASELAEIVSVWGTSEIVTHLLTALPDPAYIKDAAGRFLLLNQAAADLFGSGSPEAAIGKTTAEVWISDLSAEITADDRQVIATGEPVINRLDCLQGGPGDARLLLTTKAPVWDDSGTITGIVGTVKDVTPTLATAKVALRQSEARFRAVRETSADAIALTDANGIVLAINPANVELYGSRAEDMVGQSFTLFFPEAERAAVEANYRAIFATPDPPVAFEARIQLGDGTFRDIETRTSFVVEDGGRTAMISMVRDITDRKRMEVELREAVERYRRLVEEIPVVAYTQLAGVNGQFTYFGPQFEAIMGYTVDEWTVNPETWLSHLHPNDREHVMAALRVADATQQGFLCEYRLRARDGQWIWFRDEAILVLDGNKNPLHWQGVLVDITERKRSEAALLEAEERFRGAFDAAAIGMCIVDLDGRFLQVNRVLCNLLGYPEAELLTTTFQALTHPDDLAANLGKLDRIRSGELNAYQLEKRYLRQDGVVIWAQLAVSVVRDQQGVPCYLVGQIEDVTPRRAAEAAAAEAHAHLAASHRQLELQNTVKSEFVSVISHEFRTPLTSIQGFSELIANDVETLAEAQVFAATINQSAWRLTRLINDVLDLDRMIAGNIEMEVDSVNLNALVSDTLEAFGPVASHQLTVRLAAALPSVAGDPDRLTQVLTNLVANAIKYAPTGGPIIITTTKHREMVELTVADQGLGVPAESRESIFNPYGRIARPEQSVIAGTGLGLPITKHIVALHGGRIWVEPNHPQGSVFHVQLPAIT